MKKNTTEKAPKKTTRRKFLKKTVAAGVGAAVAAPTLFNIRTAAAQGTTWRIQTSWPGGIGLEIFKSWCNSIQEKSGGELIFKGFTAKDVVGDFQLFDAVKNGADFAPEYLYQLAAPDSVSVNPLEPFAQAA